MNRLVVPALAVLATMTVMGLALVLFRTQLVALGPRLRSARGATTSTIEEVDEVVAEVREALA